jgi:biopolymer transport protein ExbD
MGLLTTALLVANLALPPANPPKSVADTPNNPFPLIVTPVVVVVTIDDQGKTHINKNPVDREQLLTSVRQQKIQEPETLFVINPSDQAFLFDIGKIMIMMQSEGVETAIVSKPRRSPSPVKVLDNIPKGNPKMNLGKVSIPESLVISIDAVGRTYINENSMEQAALSLAIKQQYDQKPKTTFLINATTQTFYGDAAQVMDVMRSIGVKSTTLNIVLPNNQPNLSLPINLSSQSARLRQIESLQPSK